MLSAGHKCTYPGSEVIAPPAPPIKLTTGSVGVQVDDDISRKQTKKSSVQLQILLTNEKYYYIKIIFIW